MFLNSTDGSLSDTAVSSLDALDRQRNIRFDTRSTSGAGGGGLGSKLGGPSGGNMVGGGPGMGKKSSSTSQLSAAGNNPKSEAK